MYYLRTYILGLLVLMSPAIWGQGSRCLSHDHSERILSNNPDLIKKKVMLDKKINQWTASNDGRKNGAVITLPLVFHVIFNTSSQNIDSLQIASQIDVINDDFRKLNANLNIVQGGFSNLATDVQFEFKLADVDPDGNPTNGITRTVTTNPAIGGSFDRYYDPNRDGVAAWDPEKYINVWVCNINSAGGDFGFATFPGEADPESSDGCVIDFKYLGTTGTAANSQPQHLGRTLTHELGHYFGLEHIWGDVDDCSNDDNIADTPPQETSTEECLTYPFYDDCTDTGDGINFYNYMDYTDDECMAMFTADQAARMQAVVAIPYADGGRSELLSLFSSATRIPTRRLQVYPNPMTGLLSLELDESVNIGNDITVMDITGRQVQQAKVDGSFMTLGMSHLDDGVYFINIQTDAAIWNAKVVLIKE